MSLRRWAEITFKRNYIHCFAALCLLLCAFCFPLSNARGQVVVDKTVATVNGGTRTDLITYSDILWQLALQPNTPLASPGSEDLNRVLQLIVDQRLILQEAEKLPTITPTDEDINANLTELIKQFPSPAEFHQRADAVGLNAEQLREIIRQRVAIEKYLDFRFRSFTVITQKEVADYYRDVFVPRIRKQSPGRIVPTLEQAHDQIERSLTEGKVESETDAFLDNARDRAEIVTLIPFQ